MSNKETLRRRRRRGGGGEGRLGVGDDGQLRYRRSSTLDCTMNLNRYFRAWRAE